MTGSKTTTHGGLNRDGAKVRKKKKQTGAGKAEVEQALKLELGKQRLSNSCLKAGAGKIAGAEVEQ